MITPTIDRSSASSSAPSRPRTEAAALPPQPQDGWWYRAAALAARLNPTAHALRFGLVPGLYQTVARATKSPDAQVVTLTSPLGDTVDCRAFPCRGSDGSKRLFVGFHGNCSSADALSTEWRWMSQFGNVLAVNMPGYGDSTAPQDLLETELRMAANIQAVVDDAKARGYAPDAITWVGISLGGSQAAIGFSMTRGSHALFINTFTQVSHVAAHCAKSLGPLARLATWQAAAAALPNGWRAPGVAYETDRLNTEKKLRACAATHRPAGSRLLVMAAGDDQIMAPHFAIDLQRAYYGDDVGDAPWKPYILAGADHNTPFVGSPQACARMRAFLTA